MYVIQTVLTVRVTGPGPILAFLFKAGATEAGRENGSGYVGIGQSTAVRTSTASWILEGRLVMLLVKNKKTSWGYCAKKASTRSRIKRGAHKADRREMKNYLRKSLDSPVRTCYM